MRVPRRRHVEAPHRGQTHLLRASR
jgi:hypothetical protein